MKNSLKMISVIAGLSVALLGSVNEAKASNDNSNDAEAFGYCLPTSAICGITSGGTTLIGTWTEGD